MGMFDDIRCDRPLPGDPPEFVRAPGHRFQTNDLDERLAVYVITEDGRLIQEDGSPVDHHGAVDFHSGNVVQSGPATYTAKGEDAEWVEYRATFVGGLLTDLVQTERSRNRAWPVSRAAEFDRVEQEAMEAVECHLIDFREGSYLGGSYYLLWGGLEPEKGEVVRVVAESGRQLVLAKDDETFEAMPRPLASNLLFVSMEVAEEFRGARKAVWDREVVAFAAFQAGGSDA